jgi:hypothetical protein
MVVKRPVTLIELDIIFERPHYLQNIEQVFGDFDFLIVAIWYQVSVLILRRLKKKHLDEAINF